jgi:hypothetical protein
VSKVRSTTSARTNAHPPPDYIDDFLSIFDRTPRPGIQSKAPKFEKTVSTENLLRKTPSVKSVALDTRGQPWNYGIIRRIPYSGGLALLTVLFCAGSDAVILWKSDGQAVNSWTVSPSVLLAILSAVANVCLQYAHSQGVVIAWWRKALHGGKLVDLHHYWESGDGIWAAVTSGKGINKVSLATMIASAVVFDGPLLQRASNIVSISATVDVNVTTSIAEEIPNGYTGYGIIMDIGNAFSSQLMNPSFAQVVNDYTTRSPITTNFTGCVGDCYGSVKAAGLAVNCSMDTVLWNSSQSIQPDGYSGDDNLFTLAFDFIPATIFGMDSDRQLTDPFPNEPFIKFRLQYVIGRTATPPATPELQPYQIFHNVPGGVGFCNGTRVLKTCSMRSATLLYPVHLVNSTISLSGNSSSFEVDHVQASGDPNQSNALDNESILFNSMSYTTIGGVAAAAQNIFGSNVMQVGQSMQMNGSVPSQYLTYGTGKSAYFVTEDPCAINWYDPTSDIVNGINEIMFRTALAASSVSKFSIFNQNIYSKDRNATSFYEAYPVNITGSGIPIPQILTMKQTSNITVFKSNYSYLAAALALMILGILVVLPTFQGFWELGRNVSLNPLEVA